MKMFKLPKVETFLCGHCNKIKTSKNVAIKMDVNNNEIKICNGYYGEILSKQKDVR